MTEIDLANLAKLAKLANQTIECLAERQHRLVLAESCTGGLIASVLTDVPGASRCIAGSFVTYRNETKIRWLGVSPKTIDSDTEVSDAVATEMATGALARSPVATIAAAITGHLGPAAPAGFDGQIHIAIATARDQSAQQRQLHSIVRIERKRESTALVLSTILQHLSVAADPR